MSVSRHVIVTFAEPILYEGRSNTKDRDFYVDLGLLGMCRDGYRLIDRFNLPLVSDPHALADWSREITEVEYLDLVGPPDIEFLQAKHPGLRWMMEWRSKPGRETDYGQVERFCISSRSSSEAIAPCAIGSPFPIWGDWHAANAVGPSHGGATDGVCTRQ